MTRLTARLRRPPPPAAGCSCGCATRVAALEEQLADVTARLAALEHPVCRPAPTNGLVVDRTRWARHIRAEQTTPLA